MAHECDLQKLEFKGHYGAPGVGQAWECPECGKEWARVCGQFHDPAEQVHILDPEDVM